MDLNERRRRAASILDRYLGGEILPPHVPGDPASLVVAIRGSVTAHRMLDELGRLYGVAAWNATDFRKHVLEDAFPAWKPGTHLVDERGSLVVVAPGCPLEADVRDDPRICALCKAAQVAMVEQAVDGARAQVPATVTEGARECLLHVSEADA